MTKVRALYFENDLLHIIDQTKLPLTEDWIITDNYERISVAIEKLEVRGAPAIGVAAAYALALSIKNIRNDFRRTFDKAYYRLASTRPTAVNLFYGLNEIKNEFELKNNSPRLYESLISKAVEIHNQDIHMCEGIAKNGIEIFTKSSRVLTHCNAGALATSGDGTAVNVIRYAFENNLVEYVYSDETRPLLQGSRLTAWELHKYGIPFSVITDSTAASLMKENKIDLVVVGADRIAKNGDAANKIGTYNLAVLCSYHKIPFYIAAPSSTFDKNCFSGDDIVIEYRDKKELFFFGDKQISNMDFSALCPAFDVTPNSLISGIITEQKLFLPPYNF